MLNRDYKNRITCAEALNHPWFDDINRERSESNLENIFKKMEAIGNRSEFKRRTIKKLMEIIEINDHWRKLN
jgi:hypothetical protein